MMLLAERAGRKLERPSNLAPRGMTVIALIRKKKRRNKIRPTGLLHLNTEHPGQPGWFSSWRNEMSAVMPKSPRKGAFLFSNEYHLQISCLYN